MNIDFVASPRASLGVEWELQLVDTQTRDLVQRASEVLAEMAPDGSDEHPKAKHELFESTLEVITGVCSDVPEALSDLSATVGELEALLAPRGIALACAGTHPFSRWQEQEVSPDPRYAKLIEDMQWMARQLLIFGVHVHVGVRSPAKVLPVVNALMAYVPHFLALSASSPYWIGDDTGLASARSKLFEQLPTAGLPHQLSGWPDFEHFMSTLVSSHTIESVREVWWDIRPHPNFGTVELRICDGLSTLEEIGGVAALSQCLVQQLDTQLDRGYTLPRPAQWVVRENKWRAARYGLEAEIIVDEAGRTVPVRKALEDLVDDLVPVARRLGCEAELTSIGDVLSAGAGYARQREAAAAGDGSLTAVMDHLLAEFAARKPLSLEEARAVDVAEPVAVP